MSNKKEIWRAVKFLLFSISAGVIQIGSFTLLNEFIIPDNYWPCYLISLVLSIVWNFTFNRKFTFKSANNVPVAMLKVLAFYAVFTPVTTIGGNALVDTCGWNEYLVEALSMVLNFVTEFIYDKYIVFGKSIDSAEKNKDAEQQ